MGEDILISALVNLRAYFEGLQIRQDPPAKIRLGLKCFILKY